MSTEFPRETVLAFAGLTQASALNTFYIENAHPFVAFRSQAMAPLLARGDFVLAESGGEIVGAGGFEQHRLRDGTTLVELIQGRVSRSAAGIYRLLIACRVLAAIVRFGPAANIFCEIDEVNSKARRIYLEAGFVEFEPTDELYEIATSSLPLNKRPEALGYGFIWYRITPAGADRLLCSLKTGLLTDDYSELVRPERPIVLREPLRSLVENREVL